MREAFDSASRAYDSHDGAAAKSYAEDGHSYQAERDRLNAEVRALIEENKTARFSAGAYGSEVQQAKDDLDAFKAKQREDKRICQQDKEVLAAKADIPGKNGECRFKGGHTHI